MKKYLRFLPHKWFKSRVLVIIWRVFIYLLLALILYTLYNLGVLFFNPPESINPEPLRLTWALAMLQEVLLLIAVAAVTKIVQALHTIKYRVRFIKK